MSPRLFLAVAAVGALALGVTTSPTEAAVVYSNDFSAAVNGFAGTRDSSGPNADAAMHLSDTSTSTSPTSAVIAFNNAAMAAFDTAQPEQFTLQLEFDVAITSFSLADGENQNSIPRIRLQSPSASSSDLFIGFGRTQTTTGGNIVLFAARGDNPSAASSTAVTLFNYRAYNATTATSNNTGGYVHVSLSYVNQSTTCTGTATQGTTVVPFTLSGFALVSYSNTLAQNFGLLGGNRSTAQGYLDNVQIQTVPEPATGMVLVGGAGMLLGFRRGRRIRR